MTAINLEEELYIDEGGWRGRAITFGVLVLAAAFTFALLYYFFMRDDSSVARATEEYTVKRASIASNLIITGTADAQLNSNLTFQSPGKVGAVFVRTGDAVTQGTVLATLVNEELENAVASAQANQRAAQLKLDDLLNGSTGAERALAEQSVAAAQAALTKAQNDYDELLDGPTAAERSAAEQSVRLAESQLTSAQSALRALEDTPTAADLAAARAGVASAESLLASAESSAANAENTLKSARDSLFVAETSYCGSDATPAFCTARAAPVSSSDLSILTSAAAANALLASSVIGANATYLNARNGVDSAEAAVASAEEALESAEQKLAAVQQGPSPSELDAARSAVTSAQAAVDAAQAQLADLAAGATPEQLSTAQAAIDSARAQLNAAQADLSETLRGPTPNAIEQARQAVRTAALTVEAAQIQLRQAQIVAPFDGVVAAVNIAPGEFASSAAEEPPIVMLTPDALVLTMSVGETDYPNLRIDQGGVALFDGIPGKVYPFRVTEIGLSPTVTQGVVTFQVKAAITILPDSPRPAPGMNARGQLRTSSKDNILVVPPRAIRRKGSEQIVDVKRNGAVEEQVVATGVSDDQNVEIVSGLNEGDVIVVPALASGGVDPGAPTPVPTIPGGIR